MIELSNRACDTPPLCKGTRAPSGRTRRNRRCLVRLLEQLHCLGSSESPWFAASCCRDGSLAVIQPLWVQETSRVPPRLDWVAGNHPCAHPMSNACTSLGRHFNTTHPSQASPSVSVHPRLAGGVLASVRASGIERDGSCRTTCATSQDRGPHGVGPHGRALVSVSQQAPDHVPNASQCSQHRSGTSFQNSARSAKTRSANSFLQCRKMRHEQSPAGRLHLSRSPASRLAGSTRPTCR